MRELRIKSERFGPEGVAISVADTGIGIKPKYIERIFDALFTTKSNGIGMGLAICQSIVEAHDGKLSVPPGSPHGSVFRVVLPRSAPPVQSETASE